jgi:hypothetical protein
MTPHVTYDSIKPKNEKANSATNSEGFETEVVFDGEDTSSILFKRLSVSNGAIADSSSTSIGLWSALLRLSMPGGCIHWADKKTVTNS